MSINMQIKELDSLTITVKFETLEEKESILASLKHEDKKICCFKRGKQYFLSLDAIYYIEMIDKKTFIYTKTDCYESPLWLYQLEEKLDHYFIKANKSTLFNMKYIESLKADMGARIRVYLKSGDQVIVSRRYAKDFKRKLRG